MAVIAHTGWQVRNIDPAAYVTDANGDLMYGARVHFITGAGNKGSVFVSNQQLTPAAVGELINVQAALLDSIATMTAEPMQLGA